MNEAIKKLIEYNKANGYEDESPAMIWETLNECGKEVSSYTHSKHRWWNTVLKVVEINGDYYQFLDAETTGDMSPNEAGWEYDIENVKLVRPVTKTIQVITYEPITASPNPQH